MVASSRRASSVVGEIVQRWRPCEGVLLTPTLVLVDACSGLVGIRTATACLSVVEFPSWSIGHYLQCELLAEVLTDVKAAEGPEFGIETIARNRLGSALAIGNYSYSSEAA